MNPAQRTKFLLENYIDARKSGGMSGYDIRQVDPDNYEHYYILIQPKTGVYKGHSYILELKTSYGHGTDKTMYPNNPPYAHFITDVYHTNISSSGGSICVDILKEKAQWMPSYGFDAVVQNILMLFGQPNNASPYNGEASRLWVDCEKIFKERKTKNMLYADEEKLYNECFQPFQDAAKAFAKKNNLGFYAKWFPQLINNSDEAKEAMAAAAAELTELTDLLATMKLKKKPKPVKDSMDSAVNTVDTSNVVNTVDVTHAATTSTNDTASANNSVADKKVKPNRWAKHQTKQPN